MCLWLGNPIQGCLWRDGQGIKPQRIQDHNWHMISFFSSKFSSKQGKAWRDISMTTLKKIEDLSRTGLRAEGMSSLKNVWVFFFIFLDTHIPLTLTQLKLSRFGHARLTAYFWQIFENLISEKWQCLYF